MYVNHPLKKSHKGTQGYKVKIAQDIFIRQRYSVRVTWRFHRYSIKKYLTVCMKYRKGKNYII